MKAMVVMIMAVLIAEGFGSGGRTDNSDGDVGVFGSGDRGDNRISVERVNNNYYKKTKCTRVTTVFALFALTLRAT